MKKRLIILSICFLLVFGAVIAISIIAGSRPVNYFSSPDEIRADAQITYNNYFSKTTEPLPNLKSAPASPSLTVDDSVPNEIKVTWQEPNTNENLSEFGDRIPADPKTQSFALPNGQVVTLVGFAFSPKLKELIGEDDPRRWNREETINWIDPVTMEPITDLKARKLPKTVDVDSNHELIFAFMCSDSKKRPVRWHWLRVHDDISKVSVADSSSRHTEDSGLVIYKHDLKIFHNAPLRMLLPISYGQPEVQEIDLTANRTVATFGTDTVELTMLQSSAGEQNGSSNSGGIGNSESKFRFRDPKPDSKWRRSFSLFAVWPPVQGHTLQFLNGEKWQDFYPNNTVNSVSHKEDVGDLGTQKWRRFPKIARGIFEIEGIPGLPKMDNLFAAKVGPVRFDYDSQFRQTIYGPTMLDWSFHKKSLPRAQFPIEFDDPDITPDQLLKEYEKRIGLPISVDEDNHKITEPGASWKERLGKWWEKTRRNIF